MEGSIKRYVEGLKRSGLELVASKLVRELKKDPVGAADRFLGMAERVAIRSSSLEIIKRLHRALRESEIVRAYISRLAEFNPDVVKTLALNFIINVNLAGWAKAAERARQEGIPPLYTILISPSMRCNLRCVGCYAYLYDRSSDMPLELVNDIIEQGKDLGVFLYTILGGEPFLLFDRMAEEVYGRHRDAVFQVFTNGTLIDEKVADRLVELGNVVPVLSIEGDKETTDMRRGEGVFDRLVRAMDLLHERGIPFGVSLVHARYNSDKLKDMAFWDWLIEKGAVFGWVFLYMPVAKDPKPELMPTPQQRFEMGRFIRRLRTTRPIFIMDFWNDAPYIGGCIAGGRRYLHINHKGDVEPCIFAHFAVDNIKEKPLKEILKSPFFTDIRRRQPFDDNLLLPCMIIDNPHIFRELVEKYGARPTHQGAEVVVTDLAGHLDAYAEEVHRIGERYWREDFAWKIEDIKRDGRAYGEGMDRIEEKMKSQSQ